MNVAGSAVPAGNAAPARRVLPRVDEGFSPSFLIASLAITLTLGAGSGLFYLWRIGQGADVPVSHRQIHGHSQVLGFAALFVIGIAFHVLPRMLGAAPPGARTKRAVLWLMVAGVVLRNLAQPFVFFDAGRVVAFVSGLLEAAAGTFFVVWLARALWGEREGASTFEKRQPRWPGLADPFAVFLPIGGVALLAGLALSVVQGSWLAAHRDATLPIHLTEPFYVTGLVGFVLAFVYGFAGRMMPVFLGVGPARRGTFPAAAGLLLCGLALSSASWIPALDPIALGVRDAGTVALSLSALVYLSGTGVVWRRARVPLPPAPGSPTTAIRLAFGSLFLWAVLGIGSVLVARLSTFPARNPWWTDAARHLFTIGFLTLLIVGVAFRVLPVFSGKPLHSPRMALCTWILIVIGVGMRLLQYPAALRPELYELSSYMGVPVVVALVLFAVNIVKTARRSFAGTLPAR